MEDQAGTCYFNCWGFVLFLVRNERKRKFQAGGGVLTVLPFVGSFKQQWRKKLVDQCSSGCD